MLDRSRFRTKSIGVRVTETDFARLKTLADAQGKPMGEWCREVLLAIAEGPEPRPGEQTLLAEVLALRTILLNLFYDLSGGGEIHADRMEEGHPFNRHGHNATLGDLSGQNRAP